jgi:hypothetical protein
LSARSSFPAIQVGKRGVGELLRVLSGGRLSLEAEQGNRTAGIKERKKTIQIEEPGRRVREEKPADESCYWQSLRAQY